MKKKPVFKPVVTRVRLNPEQAVLACSCYNTEWHLQSMGVNTMQNWTYCRKKRRGSSVICKDRLSNGTSVS